jgi:hypothetical protein
MPLGPQGKPPILARLIRFRHFIDGLLALASLNLACQDHVPAFPQRSPPSLLTTAARGGLRSTPDCRPRRALLHLSYTCISQCGPAILARPYSDRPPAIGNVYSAVTRVGEFYFCKQIAAALTFSEALRWSRLSEQIFRIDKWSFCHAERQQGEVGFIWCGAVKARRRPSAIIEVEVATERSSCFGHAVVGVQDRPPRMWTLRHNCSTNTLRQAPLPFMLMVMPWPRNAPTKAAPVN